MRQNNYFKNKYRIQTTRLPFWDYSSDGYYFVTICSKNRINYFGKIFNNKIKFNTIGYLAKHYIKQIPNHYDNIKINSFIIMPNHVHLIVKIGKGGFNNGYCNFKICRDEAMISNNNHQIRRDEAMMLNPNHQIRRDEAMMSNNNHQIRRDEAMPRLYNGNELFSKISTKPRSLSSIIGSYKSVCTKQFHKYNKSFEWQSRYYEHIIRDNDDYWRIVNYIKSNPEKWQFDFIFRK